MKKNFYLFFPVIVILGLMVFSVDWSSVGLVWQLEKDHPDFSIKVEKDVLDSKINIYQKKDIYSEKDMEILWKLLRFKKDFYRYDYLTEDQRKEFIEKIAEADIKNFYGKFLQVNLLKYRLGLNSFEELSDWLEDEDMVCQEDNLFVNQVDWDNLFQVGAYFDIVHFCSLDYSQEDLNRLNLALKNATDQMLKTHFLEHGINNVPVYVNDCSRAKNLNEENHCLFFKE